MREISEHSTFILKFRFVDPLERTEYFGLVIDSMDEVDEGGPSKQQWSLHQSYYGEDQEGLPIKSDDKVD